MTYAYDIMKDTFCTYCQKQFANPKNMHRHIFKIHPHSWARYSIQDRLRGTDDYVREGKIVYQK